MELEKQIKLISGCTNDDLVSLMLEKARKEICIYLKSDYSIAYDNIAVDMAVYKLNRMGTEGLNSQSYSGVSESYSEGYPQYITDQLNTFKKRWGML